MLLAINFEKYLKVKMEAIWTISFKIKTNILACEQALCLGKNSEEREAFPSPRHPARPKACSQATNIEAREHTFCVLLRRRVVSALLGICYSNAMSCV